MPDCEYKDKKKKERKCGTFSTETYCDGDFSCDEEGSCTLSVPCGQTMTFNVSLLNARTLCHGALEYKCKDRNKWPLRCDPKYLGGAIQFSSTNVKDCRSLVNQERYNKDGMDCRCKICDYTGCGSDKLFCDCFVETYPISDTSSTLSVDSTITTAYNETDIHHTTPTDMNSTEELTYNINTTLPITVTSSEEATTISSAEITFIDTVNSSLSVKKITTVADSYTDAGSALHQEPVIGSAKTGLLGGIFGGLSVVFIVCILMLALLMRRKRIQKRKKQNEKGEKMLLDSFTQSTDMTNKPVPMSPMIMQEPGRVNSQTVEIKSALDLPDNDYYYSSANDQQSIQMQHNVHITQDDEYDLAEPVDKVEQVYSNESNFNITQEKSEEELYINTVKPYSENMPDDTQVTEEVYNVLNESKDDIKESDGNYGHLRVSNAGRGSVDVEDEYDELNKSGKERFAEPDETYDHTGASDVYGDQNVSTANNLKGNLPVDYDYDHVVSY